MTLRRWLAGWALLIGAVSAWAFCFSTAPGDPVWLVVARWVAGFAGPPAAIAAIGTFLGEQAAEPVDPATSRANYRRQLDDRRVSLRRQP